MSHPEQPQPESNVVPGYFSQADAPHRAAPVPPPAPAYQTPEYQTPQYQAPQYQPPVYQGQQMPAPVNPYMAPALQYGPVDPASQPLPSATPVQAVVRFFKKYGVFSGRASRSEFWMVQLFMLVMFLATAMLTTVTGDWIISVYMFFMLGCLVPGLALTSRRLHDANLHGGLTALVLIPYVGVFVVAILALLPAKALGMRFERNHSAAVPFGQQPR